MIKAGIFGETIFMKEWLVILICCALMVFNSCGSGTKAAAEVTVEEAGGVTLVRYSVSWN